MSLAARGSTIIIIIAVIGREWKSIAAVVICSGDLLFTPSINAAEKERERDFMSERCCWARSHLTHTHSLSLHNADNFGSFAGMLDQQFASFHKSLHRKEEEEEEEIRYVLERGYKPNLLRPHIAIFYLEAELEQHSTGNEPTVSG